MSLKKYLAFIVLLLLLCSLVSGAIKIGSITVEDSESVDSTTAAIRHLAETAPLLDLIIGPSEALGGHSNKGRILVTERGDSIHFEPADTTAVSNAVYNALQEICSIADSYDVTILPGTFWELDTNYRCFEAIPIINPDGNIERRRRKAHQTITSPLVDSSIHLDTIHTHDDSAYTYFVTISNESRDIPAVYGRAPQAADIWLASCEHWLEDFNRITSELQGVCMPDWDVVDAEIDLVNFSNLYHNNWVTSEAVVMVSSLGDSAGAAVMSNLIPELRPSGAWYYFDSLYQTSNGVIVTCEPDSLPLVKANTFEVTAHDTFSNPVEHVRVSYYRLGDTTTRHSWTDSSGYTSVQTCREDTYMVSFSYDGYRISPAETTIYLSSETDSLLINLTLTPEMSMRLSSDVESGEGEWVSDGWHITDFRANSPENSWYMGNDTVFLYPDADTATLTSPQVIIPPDAELSFWHYVNVEADYDYCYLNIKDGDSWITLDTFSRRSTEWKHYTYDLSSYPSLVTRLQFKFVSDGLKHSEGWYIDDIFLGTQKQVYLGAGRVTPIAGTDSTDFSFVISYRNEAGTAPEEASVVVDSSTYALSSRSTEFEDGVTYNVETSLAREVHEFYFNFEVDGVTYRFPESGTLIGPYSGSFFRSWNFGASDTGFTTTGIRNDWEWGRPTTGPSTIPYGDSLWATQLDSYYRNYAESRLISPKIDLTSRENAFMRVLHWYDFEAEGPYGYYSDGGNVKIRVDDGDPLLIYPDAHYDVLLNSDNYFIDWEQAYSGIGDSWHWSVFDLSRFCGNRIQILFDFGSSAEDTASGWYINYLEFISVDSTYVYSEERINRNDIRVWNKPNPFENYTHIKFYLPNKYTGVSASVSMLDVNGNEVDAIERMNVKAGTNSLRWKPSEDLPSGVYIFKLQVVNKVRVGKLIYME